ncbi:MAG: AMP-binding protein, partial [Firmicutes bacterium]|nr:AMP-binding protein [Bacillota bacterium]
MGSSHSSTTSATPWSLETQTIWQDTLQYHAATARRTLAWYHPEHQTWLRFDPQNDIWSGYHGTTADRTTSSSAETKEPWHMLFDDRQAPFYQWFVGGMTNAGYVEVDLPVLEGCGQHTALIFEGDRWDPEKCQGQGGPVDIRHIDRRQLLWETARRSLVLKNLGLQPGDRIALNCPNIPEQIFYIEAAKRMGIIYTPVFGGFSDKTLSDRIEDAQATLVITADGGYRNAEFVPYKTQYTDPALDRYVSVRKALDALKTVLNRYLPPDASIRAQQWADSRLSQDLTVAPAEVMHTLGYIIDRLRFDPQLSYQLRRTMLEAMAHLPS